MRYAKHRQDFAANRRSDNDPCPRSRSRADLDPRQEQRRRVALQSTVPRAAASGRLREERANRLSRAMSSRSPICSRSRAAPALFDMPLSKFSPKQRFASELSEGRLPSFHRRACLLADAVEEREYLFRHRGQVPRCGVADDHEASARASAPSGSPQATVHIRVGCRSHPDAAESAAAAAEPPRHSDRREPVRDEHEGHQPRHLRRRPWGRRLGIPTVHDRLCAHLVRGSRSAFESLPRASVGKCLGRTGLQRDREAQRR